MRIAVDARELSGRPTGVGRYLAHLLEAWSADADAHRHEWTLLAHRPPVTASLPASTRILSGAGGTAWEQWTLPRALARGRFDLLFAPAYTAPLTAPCAVALTIHDLSFTAHPEWFSWREGTRRRTLTAWSARRASVVLTVSEFSKAEITRCIGIPPARIRAIPHGITSPAVHQRLAREPMVLYVGSIFQRRHVDRLIAAFGHVAREVPGSRLEIVGENRTHPPLDLDAVVRKLPPDVRGRVALRSYVDDATLGALYARAAVFAFPSEYEGFGLTPLEALAAGVPPVVLDTPLAREVYGEAACYVGPDLSTVAPLAQAITTLLTSARDRDRIFAAAPAVLARYDWTKAARATLHALEAAAGA